MFLILIPGRTLWKWLRDPLCLEMFSFELAGNHSAALYCLPTGGAPTSGAWLEQLALNATLAMNTARGVEPGEANYIAMD